MARRINYIYCIVINNEYDYEKNGYWTDDLGCLYLWQLLGVEEVVKLDPLTYELIETFSNDELADYLDQFDDCEKSLW